MHWNHRWQPINLQPPRSWAWPLLMTVTLAFPISVHAADSSITISRTSSVQASQPAALKIPAEQLKSRNLRVLTTPQSSSTAGTSSGRTSPRLTPDNFSSLVHGGEALLEKVESQPEVVEQAGATVWQSQFRVLMPASDRNPEQVWTLRPIVRVLNALQYDEPSRQFQAQLSVGVIDEQQPRLRRPLSIPFTVAVASDNLRGVAPQSIQFERSADFKTVEVFDNFPSNPALVRILLAGDDSSGSKIELPVRRPVLQLTLNPNTILGMGLETAEVTVNAIGLREPQNMTVSLGTDKGRFDSAVLVLDERGFATTTLRSAGLGSASIEARGTPFDPVSTTVSFALPWTFLVATLLGGLVGAIATRGGRAHFVSASITGVATGLISAVLYAVGINVVGFEPTAQVGEAVSFAVAALGSVLGPGIFDKSASLRRGDAA